jgi:hypothetical protein
MSDNIPPLGHSQSRPYDRGRYSVKRENGVYNFHALLEELLGGALD